ncbi:MAG TPA: hypothetical protein VJJ82_04310 [Candidatus Nanoarchaeia archaeon]|nr:hypothetical protein [Candidatus Nanoarchaeia archaeon]
MQELLRSTIPHLEKCKAEWEENLGRTKPIVEELVGHPIEGHRNVYIVPPQVGEGHNAGNNNIVWGTPNQWPNYTAVYLWHETLHSFFPYNCSDLEHSTIELITDEELRVRLNGGSYPPFVGHPHLTEIKERILPAWRDYVKNPKRIYTFIEEQKAKLEEVKKIKLKK